MSSVTSTLRPILWTVFPTTAFGVSVSTFWCGPHASALSLYSSVPLLNCWRRTVLMLERHSLFTIRSDWEFVSLKSPSSPSLLISFPSLARLSTFISFLVNWNWILHSTWWLCVYSYLLCDSSHPASCLLWYLYVTRKQGTSLCSHCSWHSVHVCLDCVFGLCSCEQDVSLTRFFLFFE